MWVNGGGVGGGVRGEICLGLGFLRKLEGENEN